MDTAEVCLFVDDGVDCACRHIDAEHRFCSLVVAGEENLLASRSPCYILGPVVPVFSQVAHLSRSHVHHHEPLFVALKFCGRHRQPCESASVGREYGIGVVSGHAFGEQGGASVLQIVEE